MRLRLSRRAKRRIRKAGFYHRRRINRLAKRGGFMLAG